MSSYLEIQLDQQPIELCKLLKIADLVSGGGEAKVVISEGYVVLNGEVEFQKRKKVYHNDVVEFNGEVLQVIINDNLLAADIEPESLQETTPIKNAKTNHPTSINNDDAQIKEPKKRKPISF